ncbi:D-aminoacylase [Candidatus Bathyarchaeota archaeon]|nr:D-aminoacylase [Candidatus Bathyarchaeota archaeon]
MFDIIIENGLVIDGSGNPWFKSDVGIIDNRIVSIGKLKGLKSNKKINAKNHIVSPGFIDIHSHSDYPILIDHYVESKVYQGVTLEVIGNCGTSAAPMNKNVKEYREKYARSGLDEEFKYDWSTMKEYLDKIDKKGVAFNVATFVGHGTIRQNIMGYENRSPSDTELRKMKKLVDNSIEEGAFGISSGLIYGPSVFAETSELIELAKVSAKKGGIYATHIRGEGADRLLLAVAEAIEIGKKSGAPVQIAHFKASGKTAWGMTEKTLSMIESAREEGIDVTFDQYPYTASSTGLTSVLPYWALEGGAEKLLERLKNPDIRKKMLDEKRFDRWEDRMIVNCEKSPQYIGKKITEIAEIEEKDPGEVALDLLLENNTQVPTVNFGMAEDDIIRVMKNPYGMVGSDGSAISPKGIQGKSRPHPRSYGTFPRVLGHYSRDKKIIPLQEAVRKMTSAPAQKLGLKEIGLIREGYFANITIFDPKLVQDEATFVDPHKFASGIPYVICNGTLVIDKGKHTYKLPGKTVRKKELF